MLDKQNDRHITDEEQTILIVEDDPDISSLLIELIALETPYQVACVPNGVKALELAQMIHPCLFILDYILPGMNGIDLHDQLHALQGLEHVPTMMLSANYPQSEVDKRQILGIHKPFELDIILTVIKQAADQSPPLFSKPESLAPKKYSNAY